MTGVYWIKRDFRLLDNPALTAALEECESLICLYILEPDLINAPETSEFHLESIKYAFNELQESFRQKGGRLFWMKGGALECLQLLYEKYNFDRLYSHMEIGVDRTYQRDISVASWTKSMAITWQEYKQTGVFRRLKNRDIRAKLWREFYNDDILNIPHIEHFKKTSISFLQLSILQNVPLEIPKLNKIASEIGQSIQKVSEKYALATMDSFLNDRGQCYSGGISSPLTAFECGSRMSVHLAYGTISGRMLYQRTQEQKQYYKENADPETKNWVKSLTAFTARLHWRDHFTQRLETVPEMEFRALNVAYEELNYDASEETISAWYHGRTGFPMVDACIRCLRSTGFINFRMRAMITSAACHLLHIDWKTLDPLMARLYTDYEPGIHISQLQMQAGVVGINTIRIYSPHKQLTDHDPDCVFVKRWIAELREFDVETIQSHRMEPLGNYPGQVTDYVTASKAMRSQLWSIKMRKETKALAKKVYQEHGSRKSPRKKKLKTKSSSSKA